MEAVGKPQPDEPENFPEDAASAACHSGALLAHGAAPASNGHRGVLRVLVVTGSFLLIAVFAINYLVWVIITAEGFWWSFSLNPEP